MTIRPTPLKEQRGLPTIGAPEAFPEPRQADSMDARGRREPGFLVPPSRWQNTGHGLAGGKDRADDG